MPEENTTTAGAEQNTGAREQDQAQDVTSSNQLVFPLDVTTKKIISDLQTITTVSINGSEKLTGNVLIAAGTGISVAQAGKTITITNTVTDTDGTEATLIAGEDLSQDDAVYVAEAATTATIDEFGGFAASIALSDAAFPSTNGLRAQTITATERFIDRVDIEVEQDDLSDVTYECQIQGESSGVPDGTAISATVTHNEDDNVDNGGAKHQATATFDFSSAPVEVTPGSGYAIVVRVQSTTGNGKWAHNTSDTYAGGEGYVRSGGTWTTDFSGEYHFKVFESNGVAGRVYKTDASTTLGTTHYIGFAQAAISSVATGVIQVSGIWDGFSGLTPGAQYFLSDTPGAISTTAGTVSKKIGRALSATTLLIIHDNV